MGHRSFTVLMADSPKSPRRLTGWLHLLLLTALVAAASCTSYRTVSVTTERRLSFATDSALVLTTRTDSTFTHELRVDLPIWQFFPVPR